MFYPFRETKKKCTIGRCRMEYTVSKDWHFKVYHAVKADVEYPAGVKDTILRDVETGKFHCLRCSEGFLDGGRIRVRSFPAAQTPGLKHTFRDTPSSVA